MSVIVGRDDNSQVKIAAMAHKQIQLNRHLLNGVRELKLYAINKSVKSVSNQPKDIVGTEFRYGNIRYKFNRYISITFFILRLLISLNFRYLFLKLKEKFKKKVDNNQTVFIDNLLKPEVEVNFLYKKQIDIIIPIFNGIDFVKKLLTSIKKNSDAPYRLILIDDKSTDPKINRYLKVQVKSFKNAVLITNYQNLGFVKSVNKGFSYVNSEFFILLNSDTEVPKNWLSRMVKPLVLEEKLASVTPFSNDATIFSFSEQKNLVNKTYKNLSLAKIDHVFSQLPLLNPVIKVPTGVGFCMGIKSKYVNQIGFLSEEFGKGYGEENDWCMRALKAGLYHGVVNNLYIHHKSGSSFLKKEKELLLKKNHQLLIKKYPTYEILIRDFINTRQLSTLKGLVKFKLDQNKKTILIVDHDIGGGANHYRNELIQNLLIKNKQIILFTDNDMSGLMQITFYSKKHKLVAKLDDLNSFKNIFNLFEIDEIVYNNAVNHRDPLSLIKDILDLKKEFKFKITTLIHDFYPICPSYTLIDKDGKYCGVPKSIDTCKSCVNKLNPTYSGILNENNNILEWRRLWGSFIKSSHNVVCFSNSSKEILLKAYPFIKSNIKVIPHLVKWKPTKVPIVKSSNLHIGIIGAINYAKGASVLNEILNYIEKNQLQIKVTLLGEISLFFYNPKLKILGRYEKNELPNLIEKNRINMILMPSIWPETFSYVVSEIIKMDLPLVSFGLGAQGEKVKAYKKGLVLPLTLSTEDLLNSIISFNKNFSLPNRK
jgi:GT2 family glycosyltransferase